MRTPAPGTGSDVDRLTAPELVVLLDRRATDVPVLQAALLELLARGLLSVSWVPVRRLRITTTRLVLLAHPPRHPVPPVLLPLLEAGPRPRPTETESESHGVGPAELLRRLRAGLGPGQAYRDRVVVPALVARGLLELPAGLRRLGGVRPTTAGTAAGSGGWQRIHAATEPPPFRGSLADVWRMSSIALADAGLATPADNDVRAVLQQVTRAPEQDVASW